MSRTAKILFLTSLFSLQSLVQAGPLDVVKNNSFFNGARTIVNNIGTAAHGVAKILGGAVVGTSQVLAKLDTVGNLAKNNPRATAAITLLTAAIAGRTAYSYYYGSDYTTILKQAKEYTRYLDEDSQSQVGKPSECLCVWRNAPGMKNVEGCDEFLEAPFDIAFARDGIWKLLKADRELILPSVKGDDDAYKKAILTEIKKQKETLKGIASSILAKLWSNPLSITGNPAVVDLIKTQLKDINNRSLSAINKDDIKKITSEIEYLYSIFWPSNIIAQIYDPSLQQREVAMQYWKLLICIARLDAMQQAITGCAA